MKTTLGKIWDLGPCGKKKGSDKGWDKLVTNIGTDEPDTEVTFAEILKSNGIEDAVWSLCVLPYLDRCLFMADVAESVLDIFEKNTGYRDNSARRCIEGIRMYHDGQIDLGELDVLRFAATATGYAGYAAYATAVYATAGYVDYDAADYDAAAYATADYAAGYAADYAAGYATDYTAAYDAAYATADYAVAAATATATAVKWREIEELFKKHFCAIKKKGGGDGNVK